MDHVVYYLHVSINGYDAEVWLNDAPILRTSTAFPWLAFPTVSEWIVQGVNELKAVVYRAERPKEPLLDRRRPIYADPDDEEDDSGVVYKAPDLSPVRLQVALCRGQLGGLPDLYNQDILCALDWSPVPGQLPELPATATARRDIVHPFGRWSWEDAAPIALDRATMGEIGDVARSIRSYTEGGDVNALAGLMRVKFDEVGRCYNFSPEEAEEKMRMVYEAVVTPGSFELAEIDPAALDPRLCCGGRVVEVRNRDGRPAVRQKEPIGDQNWAMPVFLSKVGGQFVIVR